MRLPLPGRPRLASGLSADELRERRLEKIRQLSEAFLLDLGLLLAGHPAPLDDHLAPEAAQRLRRTLSPFLESGDVMRPNFGEHADLRVEGDLLALERPLRAQIEFDDRSTRETAGGEPVPARRRRMRLVLDLEPGLARIAGVSLMRVS